MKITKGLISRSEAEKISTDYVAFVEGNFDLFEKVYAKFEKLKRGQAVITCHDGKFIRVKVSSISPGFEGEPVVRVSNGEWSWRVDGDGYAFPV
jgi:hypothetical protein